MDLVERMMYVGSAKPWWMSSSASMSTEKGTWGGMEAVTAKRVLELVPELDGYRVEKRRAGFWSESRQTWVKSEDECFLVHTKTGTITGRCKDTYSERQVEEELQFLDRFARDGEILFHTAGILDNYKKVWLLAQTPSHYDVRRMSGKVDRHYQFLMASLDFTGGGSNVLCPTDVNVVCANTERMAVSGSPLVQRIRHSGDLDAKYEDARAVLDDMYGAVDATRDENQMLAESPMGLEEFIGFSTQTFLKVDTSEDVSRWLEKASDRSKTMLRNKVTKTSDLFMSGIGNEGVSKYDALQAFTEYFDHFDIGTVKSKVEAGRKGAKALTSAFDGNGAATKARVRAKLLA